MDHAYQRLAKNTVFIFKTELEDDLVVHELCWEADVDHYLSRFSYLKALCYFGVGDLSLLGPVVDKGDLLAPYVVCLILNHPLELNKALWLGINETLLFIWVQVVGPLQGIYQWLLISKDLLSSFLPYGGLPGNISLATWVQSHVNFFKNHVDEDKLVEI
jgi:hypothetical protein